MQKPRMRDTEKIHGAKAGNEKELRVCVDDLKTGINAENGASSNFRVKVWRAVSAMPAFCCNLISIRFSLIPHHACTIYTSISYVPPLP